jgi:two-component system alkaline phosphatase synthesis response regulator PhoP
VDGVVAVINSIGRRVKKQRLPSQIMIYKDFLVSPEYHQVFIKNTEIILTKKEFDILCFFMNNRGVKLTFDKILENVWGVNNANADVLWVHIKRIRKKLTDVSPCYENAFENVHGVGYIFTI